MTADDRHDHHRFARLAGGTIGANDGASENGGDGVRMVNCYEDPRVCNSLFTYNNAAGLDLIGCHDIVVSANQFEENRDALRCADGYNLCMTGNCVDDHLRDGVVIENT